MPTYILSFIVFLWSHAALGAFVFKLDNHTTWRMAPSLVNLIEDQNNGSYWSSAFVTATTGRQFLIIRHQYAFVCKSSVLDLQTLECHQNVDDCEATDATKTVTTDSVSLKFANFSVHAAAPDKFSELELFAASPNYFFNLDVVGKSSRVLLNGGNGAIAWGPNHGFCTHWSLPAARTSGSLRAGG